MSKRILMAVFGPIQTDARVIRASEALNLSGYSVTVISCNSEDGYRNKAFRSVNIQIQESRYELFVFWKKTWNWIKQHEDEVDLLYMHDYYMPFFGRFAAKRFSKKWVYDAHELLLFKDRKKVGFREELFFFLEKHSIKQANLVISANYERHRIIQHVYKLKNATYVQNISIAKIDVFPIERENVIVYQGVISLARKLENYVKAHAQLPKKYSLWFIGGGPDLDKLKNIAKDCEITDRVTFTGRLSQSEMYRISCNAKIGIVTYSKEGLNNYYCAPNKIFEYASLGIPMVATSQPFIKYVFAKYGIGELFELGNEASYINAVSKIIKDYNSYTKNLQLFLSQYNPLSETDRLVSAISKL